MAQTKKKSSKTHPFPHDVLFHWWNLETPSTSPWRFYGVRVLWWCWASPVWWTRRPCCRWSCPTTVVAWNLKGLEGGQTHLKLTANAPENRPRWNPQKRKPDRLPTIHFRVLLDVLGRILVNGCKFHLRPFAAGWEFPQMVKSEGNVQQNCSFRSRWGILG